MYIKYLKYLLKHKWFVLQECFKVGLYWRGIVHDLSKFLPSEFIPYARCFYGKDSEPIVIQYLIEKEFDSAWLLHQHRNPHHWQYWILQEDSGKQILLEMKRKYLLEMLCDWIGVGKAINGKNDVVIWYSKNKNIIKLNPWTRIFLEDMLYNSIEFNCLTSNIKYLI